MSKSSNLDRASLATAELQGAALGDSRRTARLERITEALAQKPSVSLPKAMGDEAALEATYRFLGNDKVSAAMILQPHVARSLERCKAREKVLCVFDTTELSFGGDRDELGYLRKKNRGFLAHVGLAVGLGAPNEPLGVLHLETVVRKDEQKGRRGKKGGPESESLRWNRGAKAAHSLLPNAVCVMDRDADIFALVQQMTSDGQEFVIRAAQNRNTSEGLLWDLLDDTELVTTRSVDVSSVGVRRSASDRKRHPPRTAHTATLELRAREVRLKSPNSSRDQKSNSRATELAVNLVHVIEQSPPEHDSTVEWILLTNLPISSADEIDFVVDAYTARWLIEEFFKALKSGCAIEKRQLESVHSLTNVLAISLPIAWLMLKLRHIGRNEPNRPAPHSLSPLMLRCLRLLYKKRTRRILPETPTYKELSWAIAALGGHIRNNGDPGFIVLGRGLADLIEAAELAALLEAEKM